MDLEELVLWNFGALERAYLVLVSVSLWFFFSFLECLFDAKNIDLSVLSMGKCFCQVWRC